ncbi:MAG: glycosyltransferase family 2 protein [Methyloprofundus sp.]|nr:glycosyltransferase family 2 protein [Methyloprofundus sp.]
MRNLRTEQEVMSNWKGDLSKPVVSVCCIAYNHEPYIEDALEGFLIQETDFPFEIIIHDDASTDKTADIIREYVLAYPNIIKPILQTENQFHINGHLPFKNTWEKVKGEFSALCEGDDYWTEPKKLQAQVDIMRQHTNINISFHPAVKWCEKNKTKVNIATHYKNKQIINLSQVISNSGGYMPTASLMIRSKVLKTLPSWFYEQAPVGDYYVQILASNPAGALYFPSVMSVYRTCLQGSWSDSMSNIEKLEENIDLMIGCAGELLKDIPNTKLNDQALDNAISISAFSFLKNLSVDATVRKQIYCKYIKYFSFYQKFLWLFVLSNNISKIVKKMKDFKNGY